MTAFFAPLGAHGRLVSCLGEVVICLKGVLAVVLDCWVSDAWVESSSSDEAETCWSYAVVLAAKILARDFGNTSNYAGEPSLHDPLTLGDCEAAIHWACGAVWERQLGDAVTCFVSASVLEVSNFLSGTSVPLDGGSGYDFGLGCGFDVLVFGPHSWEEILANAPCSLFGWPLSAVEFDSACDLTLEDCPWTCFFSLFAQVTVCCLETFLL